MTNVLKACKISSWNHIVKALSETALSVTGEGLGRSEARWEKSGWLQNRCTCCLHRFFLSLHTYFCSACLIMQTKISCAHRILTTTSSAYALTVTPIWGCKCVYIVCWNVALAFLSPN